MNPERPTPTLHDVAAFAGVSTATVSRVLNFPERVSPTTREKVDHAIRILGYSPNFGARVMAARRTHTIGAIIPTMENAIFARGLQAFQEELQQHDYTMLVASTSYQPVLEETQIRALVARGADALLLIGHVRSPSIYAFLETQNVPALVTWAYDPAANTPAVGFDNAAAMAEMAEAVIGEGHTRLGLITASTTDNDRASARLEGIRRTMRAKGLDPSSLAIVQTPYTIENGASAFAALMARAEPPTAVLCANDVLAVGALRQAQVMKIPVPDAVSIVGFDDIELAQVAYPPLTTVHVPHRDMGRKAAQVLMKTLKDGSPLTSHALPTSLVRRGSLGPAPSA